MRTCRRVSESPDGLTVSGTITLDYDGRYLRRRVVETASGDSVLIDLPEPMDLQDGAHLLCDDGSAIIVQAAEEDLLEVTSTNASDLPRLAWHIGNRHTPCQIDGDKLLVRSDHVLGHMLEGLGARVIPVRAPFRPEGGAYGHGRTHGHSHGHDPHADPNAHIPYRHD